MNLMVVKIIFEILLVPNKRVFRIQVNYVNITPYHTYIHTCRSAQIALRPCNLSFFVCGKYGVLYIFIVFD